MRKNILVALFLVGSLSTLLAQDYRVQARKFAELLQGVSYFYVDTVDLEDLMDEAIGAFLKKLDPHTIYLSKEAVKKSQEEMTGTYKGIGVQFTVYRDTLVADVVIEGGPSWKAGIKNGDQILQADTHQMFALKNTQVQKILKGPGGTVVSLKIKRPGETELLYIDVLRGDVPISTVLSAYMMNKETGYIKVGSFSIRTGKEVAEATEMLKQKGMKNLILDVRSNPGGILTSAVEILSLFIGGEKLAVYTKGRLTQFNEELYTQDVASFPEGRVIVMVNSSSASASEIVAGGIQDWDRGLVMGRRSFGKGLVQRQFSLVDGAAYRLTIAHYYTPSGRCIQRDYGEGREKYYQNIRERYQGGEFFSRDSIEVDSSQIYKTKVYGRSVYGGGGVVPDIFIPLDTVKHPVFRSVSNDVSDKAMDFAQTNRFQVFNSYKNKEDFIARFKISSEVMKTLKDSSQVELQEKFSEEQYKIDQPFIADLYKAYIGRTLYGFEAFYEAYNRTDNELIEALKIISDEKEYYRILRSEL